VEPRTVKKVRKVEPEKVVALYDVRIAGCNQCDKLFQ